MNSRSLPSTLAEVRAIATAAFASSETMCGISLQTTFGLVFVDADLSVFMHDDAVREGLTDALD